MRDRNRQQYDRHAPEYHAKRMDAARGFYNSQIEQPMMLKLLRGRVRGKRVLELGCGSGLLTRRLIRMGGRVTGLDNSAAMLSIAAREVPRATFVRADMRRVPATLGQFDVIASSLAFHYVRRLDGLFRDCNRLLKAGGVLVFSIHHPIASLRLLQEQQKMKAASYFAVGDAYRWPMLPGMELVSYHQTIESVYGGLVRAGFEIDRMLEGRPVTGSRRINRSAFDVAHRTPPFLAIRAVKPDKD